MKRIVRLPELTTKAKVLIGIVLFIFLAAAATLVVTSIISQQLRGDGKVYNFKDADAATRKKDAVTAAQSATNSGNSTEADAIYEQAIKDEPDPTKKVELAITHSRMLQRAGKFDEAVAVAEKAESYSDDKYLITDWLARLYEREKRYEESATYYEQVAPLAKSPTNVGRYSESFYKTEAERVKGLAQKS